MMNINIRIESLSESVKLGCSEEERAFPQVVAFDIELVLDAKKAVTSDSIKDTVDYMGIVTIVEKLCRECSWKLLEKMCFDIASEIIRYSDVVEEVKISSRKKIVKNAEGVSAVVTVSREELD